MQFQGFPQIAKSHHFGFALAGDIHLKALGDVPLIFLGNDGCESMFHVYSGDRLDIKILS